MTDAAMRPPPSRPDATPMSNSDFRQFMDTPRGGRPSGKQSKQSVDPDSAQASKKASRARKYKPQQQETEEAEGPGYRYSPSTFLRLMSVSNTG